ncbi:MAG TPA: adenine phosphoribosyltransferase, partial [Ruminococcaceae bacterium]|nr:adenine phosphoribosyltransferase [Oscillospiraceae bacterium]
MNTFTLEVAGVTRELKVCSVSNSVNIAAFIMFGDVELTVNCAKELLKQAPEHDIIITAEAKGIPLAYEMARQSEKNDYLVARKGVKVYMHNPISVAVKSITTAKMQKLFIDEADAAKMKGRRVLIVDDVI